MSLLVQVAGIIDLAEAELVADAGATHLGFPLRLPDGREDLSENEAAEIGRRVAGRATPVLITYLDRANEIAAFCDEVGFTTVQLHGPIPAEELGQLREMRPDLVLWKALVVGVGSTADLLAQVRRCTPWVDAFITDTYDPATGRRGATGRVHDWTVSARLVAASPHPVVLAGGLTPDNVADAVRAVRPAGVDAHSGLEARDGRKSRDLVEAFVRNARGATR
ncbi:MAG: phosphoribosylanthranilate isomerase [Xanthomonadales bacterium]|nr:phosphoribosylanthranilate isomerase [Xanthomonadales bacterium]